MKKILEIDAAETYHRTGITPWYCQRLNREWLAHAFTPAQIRFLEKHDYAARPHPKHSPTIEIFVDEHSLTETDWTIIRILF